LLTNLEADKRL